MANTGGSSPSGPGYLRITTLNVHGWVDASHDSNIDRIVTALQRRLLPDILVLQEVSPRAPGTGVSGKPARRSYAPGHTAIDHIASQLGSEYVHTGSLTDRYAGVSIISRYPILHAAAVDMTRERVKGSQDKYPKVTATTKYGSRASCDGRFKTRCMLAVVQVHGNPLSVLGLHLDHVSEPVRLVQWKACLEAATTYLRALKIPELPHLPMFVCGDLNALTQEDYDTESWQEIIDVRTRGNWEYPVSELTDTITGLAGGAHPQRGGELNRGKGGSKLSARRGTKGLSHSSRAHVHIPTTHYTDAWIASGRKGDVVTCRFDTRIDYIYYNARPLQRQGWILDTTDVYTNPMSDHNAVTAVFHIDKGGEVAEIASCNLEP